MAVELQPQSTNLIGLPMNLPNPLGLKFGLLQLVLPIALVLYYGYDFLVQVGLTDVNADVWKGFTALLDISWVLVVFDWLFLGGR